MAAPSFSDSDVYVSTTNQSSWTQAHDIVSGTDTCLIVCIHVLDTQATASFVNATTVKLGGSGGTALTKIAEGEAQGNSRTVYTGWFYLLNPTPGSTSIYWSNSTQNATRQVISAFLLENVAQTSPINAQNSGNGGDVVTSLEATITGTSSNSITVYGWTNRNGTSDTSVTGATQYTEQSTGADTTTDLVATTAYEAGASGAQSATCTWGGSERASFAAFQIEGTVSGSTYAGTVTDGIDIGDSSSSVGTFPKSVSDGFSFGDSASRAALLGAIVSDSFISGDTSSRTALLESVVSDGLVIGQSAARSAIFGAAVADGLAIGSSGDRSGVFSKLVSDGVAVGEAISRVVTAASLVADAVTLSDSTSPTTTFNVSRADGLAIGEAIVGALSSATVTLTVSTGSDDGVEDGSNGNVLLTTSSLDTDSTGDIIGFIARNLPVANAATITDAYINVWTNNTDRDSPSVTIGGEGDPADLTTTNSDFSNRTLVTPTVDWVDTDIGISAYKSSPDISTIIQDIVDDVSWVSGGDVGIFLTYKSGGGWLRISAYDEDSAHAPQLVVTYTTGAQTIVGTVSDGVVIGALGAALLTGVVSLSDALVIADSISGIFTAPRTASDGVVLSSLSSSTLETSTLLLDGLALADSPSAVSSLVVSALDAFVVGDLAEWLGAVVGVVADSLVIGDTPSSTLIALCSLDDGVVISDNGAVSGNFFVDVSDAVSLADAISVISQIAAAITDGFTIGDITFYAQAGGILLITITADKPGLTATGDQIELTFTLGKPGFNITARS